MAAASRADAALSLLLTTDGPMRELNLRWRDEDHPTDVLSFPAAGPSLPPLSRGGLPPFLGDVVLNLDAVQRQAGEALPARLARLGLEQASPEPCRWGPLEEATFLLIHGVLHLLGHDHHEPAAEAAMVAEEARLMRIFLRPPWRRRQVVG